MAVQMMWAAQITVTNTSDDVEEEGSLRWACATATAEDTIVFKFSTKGDKTIHISSYLTTNASIDGSTWADSIIIEGTNKKANNSDDGFRVVGAFVKKIVVKNCYAGFHVLTSTAKSNAFYDCIASNCRIGFYCENSSDVSIIRCKSLNNDNYGITSGSRVLDAIEDCDIIGNKKAGIYGQAKNITGCRIYNNDVGIDVVYNSDLIDDCVISGNTTYGIHVSGKVKKISNNVIGLTEDQKDVYSNDNGIYIQGSGVDILSGNVISGNLKDGINSSLKGSDIGVFMGNYIGTNKYFVSDPKFGNGANGYYPSSSSSYPKFSRNYFGNNAENGIKGSFSGTISFEDCYFGITPDGDPMPNRIDGLNVGSSNMTFKNCHVGYNEGSGINVTRGTVTVNGGEFIGNKEMGLSLLSGNPNFTVEDAIFDSNGNSAISFDNKGYLTSSLISNTKFLRTNKAYPAYSTTNPYPVPEFTSCKMTEKTIEIVGKVDTEEEVKIELFYTSQGEQTAEKLVYSSTETDGTFSISLDRSEFAGKSIIGFTATATYGGKYTSPLSDVVYPELGKVDLTRTEFYVKIDGYGDGSTWEKAMSPQTFAYYLPQAKDGSTFHVAEGTYYPMYDSNLKQANDPYAQYTIKSDVTIKGGYPANATKGAKSDPKEYKTIFSGDYENDDEVSFVKETDGSYSLTHKNYEDNAAYLFFIIASKETNIVFDGVAISNTSYGIYPVYKTSPVDLNVNINNVSFENISGYAAYCSTNQVYLDINHSSFKHNNNCIFVYTNINVRNTTFEENGGDVLINVSTLSDLISTIDSVSFVRNTGNNLIYSCLEVRNSIFDSNIITKTGGNSDLITGINNRMSIINTKFKNNQSQSNLIFGNEVVVSNCSFVDNISYQIVISENLSVSNSYVYNHQGSSAFYSYDQLTLLSDTIESCKLESRMIQSGNCRIDSCLIKNNDSYLFYQSGNLDLLNTEITGNYKTDMDKSMSVIDLYGDEEDVVNIYNTIFEDNKYKDCVFLKNEVPYIGFKQCVIESNEVSEIFNSAQLSDPYAMRYKLNIEESTFGDNKTAYSVIHLGTMNDLYSVNSTYVNNTTDIAVLYGVYTNCELYNNTILSNDVRDNHSVYLGGSADLKMSGNIIESIELGGYSDLVTSQNNVFICDLSSRGSEKAWTNEENTISLKASDCSKLFDGEYDSKNDKFEASLKDNGGFTPTVALKSDKLSDGKSIRFPRLDDVLTDQRGVSRLPETCMGAYEIGCGSDTTNAIDTIVVGSKFVDGKVYGKLGIYEKILSNHKSKIGCDSVVNHTLYVVPDPKIKEYYVKTSKKGKGDGSSWDDAMDPKTFAFVFENLKTEGVTFYIAEGKYYAVYDGWGKETNNKNAHWSSKHGANIYGGYDSLSTGNASTTKANPALYRTIMTGDFKNDDNVKLDGDCGYTFENFSDNMNSSMISMEVHGDVHISGVELTGMTFSHGTSPALIRLIAKSGTEYSATIDHCKLSVADKGIEANYIRNLIVDHCEVDYVKNSAVYSNGDCKVTNSTFNHTAGINYDGNNSNLVVENSTFVKNRSDIQLYIYGTELSASAQINNNTFISCEGGSYLSIYDNVSASLSGNIFAGSEINIYKRDGEAKQQTFANNVIACKTFELGESGVEKDNIKVADITALYKILEGTYSESDGIFTPALTYKGAETRTVALLEETLSDGTPVRFPRLKNVLTDQRGVSRLEKTCMGAYEIGCGSDTTYSTDTINVGTKIYGQTFTKVGVHDSIFETLQTAMGCDSVVMHKVVVKPDPTKLNYYVKMDKENDGDGRDWDNAMSGEDFATYLPLAPDGATFYVAEGTYKPVYDVNMNIPSDLSDLCYAINSSVTIRGGYPADAKGKDVPSEPDKYRTIFSGDLGDNFNTGIQTLFLTAKEKLFSIYGLNFVKTKDVSSSSAAIISNGNFIVNQCVFDSCFCAILLKNSSSAFIDSCLFTKSWAPSINVSEEASLTVSNSKFEDNVLFSPSRTPVYCGAAIYSQGIINVDKCIFENNKVGMNGYSTSGGGAIAIVTNKNNSHIKHSYFKNNSATHGGSIYLLNGDSISIDGCTFVDNYTLLGLGNAIYSTARGNNTLYKCLSNNTFYKNDDREYFSSTNVIDGNDITHVVNNTFVNNHVPCFNLGKTLIEGNIIVSDTTIGRYLGVLGESNLVSDNISVDGVISVPISEFGVILDGVYDLNNNTFIPTLADNGGFTPTVALKSDKLSDGKSIRFPRLENVLTDQRGVERLDSTCMGAYELGCVNDTTFTTDTIYVGDKILGQTFTKVGVHDSIFETLKSSLDCDSVVMHRVVVKPDPKTFNYYVKMDKEGRGDGSDWDNAMDSTDFATYLPLAPDGATFYVAAGTYKPVFDINGNVSDYPLYNINSSVSIYGGYPANATGKEVPSEPDKYKTVLGYDVNCSFALFYSEKNELLSFVLDGVYVNDYCSYVIKMPSVDLTLRNSYFEGNSNFCDVSNEGSLNVVNTEFSKTQYTLFSMYGTKSVYMEDVKFVENIPSSYFYGDGYDVNLKSVSATSNNGYYYFLGSKKLLVENSEFTKNSTGSYLLTTSGTVDIQNSLFDQNEGSMLVNSDLSYEDSYINISKSKFSNNTTSSPVIYGARSSINCTLTESEFSNNNCYDLLFLIGSDYLTINDCEFLSNNCEKSNSNWTDDPFMIQIRASVKKIQIERNKIIDNKSLNSLVRCNCDTLIFKDCFLDKNNTDSRELLNFIICTNSQNTDKNVAFVERNTFSNNKCFYLMFLFNSSHDVYLRNNTIVSNECGSEIWYPKYSDVYLENNTIVGNKCKSVSEHDFLYKSMVGNFIFGNQYEKLYRITARDIEGEPLYNVMPLTIDNLSIKVPNSTNIVSEYYIEKLLKELEDYPESDDISNVKDLSVEISSVLEGTYDPTTGLFTPVLAYNGGFTPTVALKSDKLSDGTSIRFPRLENVLTDQRGVERLDETCMGAYEIRCTPIITELKDTVMVGDSYTFIDKNLDDVCKKVGSYYFSDTLVGSENCDSIVKLSLAVRPQKNENGYYVKVDGTGDGSDWINAMSPKDFAEYLPLVYDGETFHIAAGTYKSTYVDPELGRMYNINSSVTLIGGYPDTVTTVGVPPMPENFTTTLSANERGHINFYKERTGDFSVSGFGSNDSILIRVNGTSSVSLYGITLSGVKSSDNYGAVTMGQGGTLNLDRCTIENNNTSAVVASGAKINVTSSLAYHNVSKDGAVFRLSQSDLNVENSSFHENVSSDESSASMGAVANLTASQANFKNNTIANNWADKGTVFALANSKVSLFNNTLVGNQSIAKEPKGSFVSASDTKSKVSLFGNMIVGNGVQPVDGAAVESEGYNIFSTDFQGSGVETDMFMGSADYEFVMDGTPMNGNTEVFIANVRDNGGFTPTMAVIESMFDGGKVVSIPAEQRKVETDQREMLRKDSSCVGAFEFPTYVNYYVKQTPVGDGTGRDWDNAMGDTTFFRYFSVVPTGATFHVAAGTYHPLMDRLYNTSSNSNGRYYSSRPVNVFGGYHPQAKNGAVADPSKYVTLLSGDLNEDDVFEESDKDYTVMDFSNHQDNTSSVMTIVSKLTGDVQLKGLTFSGNFPQFRGSSAALSVSAVAPETSVSLILDSCSFKKTYIGIYSGVDSLFVRNCRFDSIDNLGFSHYPREEVSGVLVVENSSFTNMDYAISASTSKGKVLLQNSTFSNTKGLVNVITTTYNKVVDLSLEMYHNTFAFSPKSYGGIEIPNYIQTIAKGNIFNTNILLTKDYDETNAMKPIVSDYNLFVENPDTIYGAWTLGENDMLVTPSDLTGVLPGKMVEKRFNAVSTLEKPENFTKVVALESDVLNEKYIRMPIEEAKVKSDQIATERLDLTCMGAYEFFKGRDTVYITSVDTVCYGLNYQRRGWNLQSDTLSEGEYVYGRFLRGKVATDTIDTLTLHVNPFSKIILDQLAVAPTLCHGSGYGEVSFTPRSVVPGSAAVYVNNELGDTLFSGVQLYNSAYKYNELPLGKFVVSVLSQTQCVKDTLFDIEVFDRDSLQALPGADNILTDCANEPNSELTISLIGFHPTMKFYHNGVEISDQTNNGELIYGDDAAVTATAELKLTSIPVGSHTITAVDVCDNSYPVKDFEVSVIPSQVLDMQLVDYTKETLACGLDSGFAKFHIMSGATSLFTLTSDNGYDYSLRVQGKDTVLILNDLTRGNYTALLKKESEDCSDSYSVELSINSPEPLSLSLTSNGAACAEGAVSVVAEGGTGEYTYHWTDPTGAKFVTKEPGLNEASAGKYTCVVEDETHCFSHSDSLAILPNVDELSELLVDSVSTKNITCFKGENGTIEVYFSTDNKQQSVACVVTNSETKEETKTAGTYEKLNGELAIRTLGVGSYSYEVYYGTEGCRLDTNSFKGTFTISAKEVPFVMTPLAVFAPQTCIEPSNGMIVNTATGWEDDYNAYLMTEAGGKHIMTPVEENGETKLYAGLLSGGSYYYLVEDACGSELKTDPISLPKYEPLSLEIVSYTDSVTCARATDAEISFTVSGGIGLNHLAYIDEKAFTDKGTIVSEDNGKGYHYVTYKSVVEGCKDSVGELIRIAGPDTLAIKYTLNGNCLGSSLLPEVTGESAPYTYLWSDGVKEINGTEKFPFDDMGEGKTYSLTVSDAHKCDTYTKSFTIPSAAELPTVSQKVYPESEKCHKGNDGRIIVKPSLSKKMDYAVTATIFYHKLDSKDSIANECVLDPNGEYTTPENLEPGYYRVTTRLGSMDCDMGVAPVTSVVHVDTLPPLKIQSEFTLTDHTCISPNGTASFNIEGWTYTHVADIYSVGEDVELYRGNVRPTSVSNYVGAFDVTALPFGTYKVVVKDRCGNKDESEPFEILHKPTFIQNIKTEKATCINEPNGVLDFEVQGWTLSHGCEFVKNDVAAEGRIVPVLPVKYDTINKLAYFHVNTMPAGKWRIWVSNECKEAFRLDTFVTVPGIEPYKVDLIANESKLELDCPYDSDGKIVLNVTGGYSETVFSGGVSKHVKYYGPTGEYVDSTVYVKDTSYVITALYDSLNPIINVDTTYKFLSQETVKVEKYDENNNLIEVDSIIMHYDTILVETVTYPQLTDEEGNFINDTTLSIDSFATTQRVPKIGELDSIATSVIEYDLFSANPIGRNTGKYTYMNLDAGTYRFTFKTALEGCSDKYNYDTEITKPADVKLVNQVLPISCSSYIDGEISLAPRRGGTSYSYYVGHDSTDTYEKNRLYADVDGNMVEHSINGVGEYQIDQLFDQSDIKTIKWSYNAYESSVWTPLDNIIFPDSSDITEETYYKNGVVVKTPVYSNTHLEKFWHGYMGDYFEANVVSIANLAPGFYSVLVEDAKRCQYRDTFEVKLPPMPLKIDSVKFDAALAECDPSKRQILAYASGGWGSYNFTFSDKSKVEKTDAKHSDGFRGGEATYYDKNSMTGWGVSYFLDPGNYSVVVLDEQGCLVEYDKTFEVKTTFSLTMDSTRTICPEDPTAKVVAHFVGSSAVPGITYDVVEYVSPCSKDTLDDCREYTLETLRKNVTPKNDTFMVDLTSLKMHSKTHGLFVYQNDENHCGTYVQGTVVDTIPIFKSSRKSSLDVTCGGLENGQIELYVSGGTAPYKIQRNSAWKKGDELALYENLDLIDTTFKLVLRDPKDTLYKKDTIIEQHFIRLASLPADTFYFTVIDDAGCKSVMGDTASFDEKIVIKAPEKLEAEFASSLVCKEPSVTKGGNIFFQNVKGGTAPYTLSYNHDYLDVPVDNSEAIAQILDAKVGFKVDMKVTDANNCTVDSTVEFKPGELQIDMYDFWATSWYEYGDVVALIDVCGPEATFDSVSYVFYDEKGKVDPRITMLDKRLYVYDLAGNKSAADTVYRYGDNTKTMVPDAYFEKRFKLREDISKGQAKHLNFFKFEDSSIDVKNVNDVRDALAKHTVLMKAYFLGCEYRIERKNPLGVINPNNRPKIDPIGQKYQIISFSVSPNPFKSTDKITIKAEFSEKVNDAEIYIYQIDGKTSPDPIKISSSELILKENEYEYSRDFNASDLFSSEIPDYIILLLKTGRDQKSTTLLYYGVNDSYWK